MLSASLRLCLAVAAVSCIFSSALLAQDGCGLEVDKQCRVVQPDAGEFVCSDAKPIDSLTMIWNGADGVRVKAWKGSIGGTLLAEFAGVGNGQAITVSGMGGSPNDQFWEIFSSSGQKLGESNFHISCSDDSMDGPEDCGLPAGNGKGDDPSLLNLWKFDGMAGSGQVLDCTPEPPPFANDCSFQKPPRPSCEALDKPTSLTFLYSGGACDPAGNDQGSKTACMETGSLTGAASVTAINSDLSVQPALVELGDEFTVSGDFSSATVLLLDSAGGAQELNIHTSCSAPLAAGDVFGGLTLVAFNGQRNGTVVDYRYTVSNTGIPLSQVVVEDNLLGVVGSLPNLPTGATENFYASAVIDQTTINRVDATGDAGGGTVCAADDSATVTLTEACDSCKGGVTELVFAYLGDTAATVAIYDDSDAKADKLLFVGDVDPFDEIPIGKRPGEDKLSSSISLWVNGDLQARIHTSCSQPIGPGLVIGDFQIVEGRSKDNGLMCELETCNLSAAELQLHDEELRLEIDNNGDANVAIDRIAVSWPGINGNLVEIKREGDTIHEGEFSPGYAEIDSGWKGGVDKRTIEAGDSDKLKLKFEHEADRFSDYALTVDFDQGCSLTRSFETLPGACDECEGGTVDLALEYLGPQAADVVVYDYSSAKEDKILYQGPVDPGDLVAVSRLPDKDKLNGDISIYVNGLFHAELHTSCSKPIGPELRVGDFRIDSARSRYNGPVCPLNICDVEGQFLDIDGDKMSYPITNVGDVDLVIESIRISWPVGTGYLEKVKNDGSTIQEGLFTPPFAEFESVWEGNTDDRTIKAGYDGSIEFEFTNDASFAGNYVVDVDFDQGCSSRRVFFGPGECGFVCEKPITALIMRWGGSDEIDVVAWDGPVGSTLIRTISGVNPGSLLVLTGISGDNNDIFWEIFDSSNGQKIGESKFHLSCSDDDMDGPEDFLKPAGNGKDDSGAYINDWRFLDMEANGRRLICED